MTRVYARNGRPVFVNGWPRASGTRMRRQPPRKLARGLGACLLLSAGLIAGPAMGQTGGLAGLETSGREAAQERLKIGIGQLREAGPGAMGSIALPASTSTMVNGAAYLPAFSISSFQSGQLPPGSDWSMGVNAAVEKTLARVSPQAYMVPCETAKPEDPADKARLEATRPSFIWCSENKATGTAPPRGSKVVIPTADALQRFHGYLLRCASTINEMGGAIRVIESKGFRTPNTLLIQRYIACSAGWRDLPPKQQQWIERRLFVIGIKPQNNTIGELPCTGLALRPDLIVTARHCFFPGDVGNRPGAGVSPSNVRAFFIGRPGIFVQARELLDADGNSLSKRTQQDYIGREDIAFIKLATPVDLAGTSDALLAAPLPEGGKAITDVIIAGFHSQITTDPSQQIAQNGGAAVRYDNSGGCMVVRFNNARCYFHTCQTGPGVSGAPILKFREEAGAMRAYLLGIHTGTRHSQRLCQGTPDTGSQSDWDMAAVNVAEFPVGKLFEK